MKVLFDHNFPAKLRRYLPDHEVYTAAWLGWDYLSNGELLKAAESAEFDVMISGDQNIVYQQNNKERRIALVILSRIDWPAPLEHLNAVKAALDRVHEGSYELISLPGW